MTEHSKNWYFESFTGRYQTLHGETEVSGRRAIAGDITVEVRYSSQASGTGLVVEYTADEVQVVDLPTIGMSLYEFIGLDTASSKDLPGRNVSIVGPRDITEDIPTKVGDSGQWNRLKAEIKLDSSASVDEIKAIRSTDLYREAVDILTELYAAIKSMNNS